VTIGEKAPFSNVFANNIAGGLKHRAEETDGNFGIGK